VRFHWLLLSCLSVFLFSSPAKAARLLFWRFNPTQNQLVFTTDEGIEPTATIDDEDPTRPTRLIVDLPETVLGRPTINQTIGGKIAKVRVGQFDTNTTRIVLELAPGYTLDPQKVRLSEKSRNQWAINLPLPERASNSPSYSSSSSEREQLRERTSVFENTKRSQREELRERARVFENTKRPQREQLRERATVFENANSGKLPSDLQATDKGLLVRMNGSSANQIRVRRSSDRRRIDFEIEGVNLPSSLISQELAFNRHGVREVAFSQTSTAARISLNVSENSPNWTAFFSRFGGLLLFPKEDITSEKTGTPYQSSFSANNSEPTNGSRATITSVEISNNNSRQAQVLIRADRTITAKGAWNRTRDFYEIRIFNAELAESFSEPQQIPNSPISKIFVLPNPDTRSVVILVKANSGVRIEELGQQGGQILALQLRRYSTSGVFAEPIDPPVTWNPPKSSTPSNRRASVPQKRIMVVIDPGHGGKDPGTIGIGGTQEKNVVLPVSKMVAEILEQQGVQVMMTRASDYFVSLQGRTEMANRANATLFVSIHANAINMSRPDVNGLETYYYQSGQGLARAIHRSILQSADVRDRGVRRARFYVLRHSDMPSVLVELGFLTGREDAANLKDPNHRRKMAVAIANGIMQYVRQSGL
jgi:N-acetylmuramoyl-L-alanine amidase